MAVGYIVWSMMSCLIISFVLRVESRECVEEGGRIDIPTEGAPRMMTFLFIVLTILLQIESCSLALMLDGMKSNRGARRISLISSMTISYPSSTSSSSASAMDARESGYKAGLKPLNRRPSAFSKQA